MENAFSGDESTSSEESDEPSETGMVFPIPEARYAAVVFVDQGASRMSYVGRPGTAYGHTRIPRNPFDRILIRDFATLDQAHDFVRKFPLVPPGPADDPQPGTIGKGTQL